ncbi:trypsin-like peptidase domain-containing protein [Mesorhizobium sp. B3-1-3]|uniref:S1 family peptidase n=1 Tax=unclassified Mesorhizobium TaxID=325217 RepID=UPI00112D4949|nr:MULTISPECIES: serine protease [unclassified Mesorhizobium]TPI62528.1 trypsin-like peptidase domain-containing protein [Mesorhizobium sp. B3-1-8]TPI74097.1 trypsin-like peptidase domain-containing protein [Mesorhizobium sp. B3-1-3]
MVALLSKLVYTVLLASIAVLAARELLTVWFDSRVYIGKFDVVSDAAKDAEEGDSFPKRIVAAQKILSQQFIDYQSRRSGSWPSDTTYAIYGEMPVTLPPEVLAGIDITVQEINLRQVLTAIRRAFLSPNEVSGQVTSREGSVIAAVDWPKSPELANGAATPARFLTPNKASEQEVAAYIACSISWIQAASGNAKFASISRAQMCDFAAALDQLYSLEGKASTAAGLDPNQTDRVRRLAAALRNYYDAGVIFPDIYRLRADLLDLLPETGRSMNELVEAQEDRVRYAMLAPELSKLSDESKRLAALALARPAILLEDGKPKDAPINWSGLLARHGDDIKVAADATGWVSSSDDKMAGVGFLVGDNLMITADYVLNAARSSAVAQMPEITAPPKFCLGSSAPDCKNPLEIGETLYDGSSKGQKIVLVQLKSHNPVVVPPLALNDIPIEPNAIVGRYAYVIGYPFRDSRLPPEFVSRLLGDKEGQKRAMPGRILAYGTGPEGDVSKRTPKFTTDISTSSGTGGGPLLDLLTGKVIGLSYAGIWEGERGKFAYAEPIPAEVVKIIADARANAQTGNPTAAAPMAPLSDTAKSK